MSHPPQIILFGVNGSVHHFCPTAPAVYNAGPFACQPPAYPPSIRHPSVPPGDPVPTLYRLASGWYAAAFTNWGWPLSPDEVLVACIDAGIRVPETVLADAQRLGEYHCWNEYRPQPPGSPRDIFPESDDTPYPLGEALDSLFVALFEVETRLKAEDTPARHGWTVAQRAINTARRWASLIRPYLTATAHPPDEAGEARECSFSLALETADRLVRCHLRPNPSPSTQEAVREAIAGFDLDNLYSPAEEQLLRAEELIVNGLPAPASVLVLPADRFAGPEASPAGPSSPFPRPEASPPTAPVGLPSLPTTWPSLMSAADIARQLNQPLVRVESCLRRTRDRNRACALETSTPRKNEPRILYRVAEVWSDLARLVQRWAASPAPSQSTDE